MTQGQWLRARASAPSFNGASDFTRDPAGTSRHLQHPVENVSYDDTQVLLARLDLTLPTEAQWEYGARAGTTTVWFTGNERADLKVAANLADESYQRAGGPLGNESWDDEFPVPAPVGRFAANDFGLHDVHGNVGEWCRDWFDEYSTAPAKDPEGPSGGSFRVTRDGGWKYVARHCRSADRNGNEPGNRYDSLGFRPSRSLR
jgi:formylglycine-generating enzyme required for sulfatase activity